MAVTYRKLWKLLKEKGMNKTDLHVVSGVSTNSVAKMGRNQKVHVRVLQKVCIALDCEFSDVVEYFDDTDDSCNMPW